MYEVLAYTSSRGRNPFAAWYERLPTPVQPRIDVVIARMVAGNLGDTRSVGEGVMERRVHFGPGYRLYFAWDGPTLIILLGGGDKSSQRNDIAAAKERWLDYRMRTHQGGRR